MTVAVEGDVKPQTIKHSKDIVKLDEWYHRKSLDYFRAGVYIDIFLYITIHTIQTMQNNNVRQYNDKKKAQTIHCLNIQAKIFLKTHNLFCYYLDCLKL